MDTVMSDAVSAARENLMRAIYREVTGSMDGFDSLGWTWSCYAVTLHIDAYTECVRADERAKSHSN